MGCSHVESKKPQHQTGAQKDNQPVKSKATHQPKREEPKQDAQPENNKATVSLQVKEPEFVKISIPVSGGKKWEKSFSKGSVIKDIVDEYKKDNQAEFYGNNDIVWKLNQNPMNLDAKLESVIPKDNSNVVLNIEYDIIGLPNLANEKVDIDRVGKPFASPFEVFIFSKKEKVFQTVGFDQDIIDENELEYYSDFSAYCNGNETLFISGGKNVRDVTLGHFWTINLNTKEVEKHPSGMNPKRQHSMIFVPNSYVFIVGGNTEETFYYDTTSKNFVNWAPLNAKRSEPALAIINNTYLYAFDNIRIKENASDVVFERTNLRKEPMWEIVKPELDQGVQMSNFKQKFFGVCPLENDNLIFLGGNMDKSEGDVHSEPFCYTYNTNNNMLSQSQLPFKPFDFNEKTFYPLTENSAFIIPYFNRTNPKLVIFNKKKDRVNDIQFEPKMSTPDQIDYLEQDDNVKHNLKLSQSVFPKMNSIKYNFNMPKFTFEEKKMEPSTLQPPIRVPDIKAPVLNVDNPQINEGTIDIEPIKVDNNEADIGNAKPTTVKSKRMNIKPTTIEIETKPVEPVVVNGGVDTGKIEGNQPNPEGAINVQYPDKIIEEKKNQAFLAKKTLQFEKIEPTEDQLKQYNYKGQEDIDKADLLKEKEIVVEPVNVEVEKPEVEVKAPVLKGGRKKNIPIGETYITESKEEVPPVTFTKNKVALNNSGTMLKSSIIKGNKSSMLKNSELPHVNRSELPFVGKITVSNNFEANQVGDMKSSVNVGLAGKKNASSIVQ